MVNLESSAQPGFELTISGPQQNKRHILLKHEGCDCSNKCSLFCGPSSGIGNLQLDMGNANLSIQKNTPSSFPSKFGSLAQTSCMPGIPDVTSKPIE